MARGAPHLMPVGLTGIPRADVAIQRTIETLRVAQFEQDPLFDAMDSFRLSLQNSAIKREGSILEAAIKDAVEQSEHLRLLGVDRKLRRIPDVQFEIRDSGWIVALEVKRGVQHDSTKMRAFRADLEAIPALLRAALPLFPIENMRFHILFVSGVPRLREGLTPDDLGRLYGLHTRSHIMTARQRYSAAIKAVLRERGL
jgi:hypothetical protein